MALPLIFAGIRTAVVFVIATATIAAVAGGGGLGDIIVNQAGYGLQGVVGAAICVSLLALAADGALGLVQRAADATGTTSRGSCVGAGCCDRNDPADRVADAWTTQSAP